jgi:hypothetical protein
MFNMPGQFHRGTICRRISAAPRFAPEPLRSSGRKDLHNDRIRDERLICRYNPADSSAFDIEPFDICAVCKARADVFSLRSKRGSES